MVQEWEKQSRLKGDRGKGERTFKEKELDLFDYTKLVHISPTA